MTLPHVAPGDPHVAAHNDERDAIDDIVESLAPVAISGDYSDLDGKPVVGTTAGTIAAGDDSRIVGAAPLASPAFTGNPTAPTVAASDNDTTIATTAFVKQQDYQTSADVRAYVGQIKVVCTVATTANIALTGLQTIDGVAVSAGTRVLVKNQTTTSENGIYIAAAGAWTRSTDTDTNGEVNGAMVTVTFGAVNTGTIWVTRGTGGAVVGAAPMLWYKDLSMGDTGTADGQIPLLGPGGRLAMARIASGTPDGTKFVRDDGTLAVPAGTGGGGTGDVVGPAASTTDNITTFGSATGKAIKDSGVAISSLAPKADPVFTGDPKAPTAAASDDDTTIATTAHVKDAIQGGAVIAMGNIGGAVNMSTVLNSATAVNANLTATLTAHVTITAATMPAVAAGTQFVMTMVQGGTGSYTLTLTNIKKPGGAVGLVLSTAVGAEDQIVFYYNGTNWYAAFSGKAWAI